MLRGCFKQASRTVGIAAVLMALALLVANWWLVTLAEPSIYQDLERLPTKPVAIVFGTSRYLVGGGLNPHYRHRIDAAVRLYQAGKIRHILVSGDNAHVSYNEPRRMYQDLVRQGVPPQAITLDFAGFSTFDTLERAQHVFGLKQAILVTQSWHLPRALYIARVQGMQVDGFAAASVSNWRSSLRVRLREALARLATLGDLHLWQRRARFLGGQEPIEWSPPGA